MVRPMGNQNLLEKRRKEALRLVRKGFSAAQVARGVGASTRSVRRWKALYRLRGMEGLKAKPVRGRPKGKKPL